MVLPTILYSVPDALLTPMMEQFQQVCDREGIFLRIEMHTNRYQDACRMIESSDSVLLLITCASDLKSEEGRLAIQLGRLAVQHNRDNYVIYNAHDSRTLIQMAPYCPRAAALTTDTILCAQGQRLMQSILRDYRSIHQEEEEDDWLVLKVKNSVTRVSTAAICAVTSANKKIDVHTLQGTLTVHDTLENFAGKLDGRFCRCHRSCLINRERIQRIDFQTMTIVMMNGMQVPLARSFRQAFHALMGTTEKAGDA